MTKWLFPNFLQDAAEHQAVVDFWAELCGNIAAELGQQGRWHRWESTPNYCKEVVYDLLQTETKKAIHVQQEDGITEPNLTIVAHMDIFDEGVEAYCANIVMFSIRCRLSRATANAAKKLFRAWMREGTTRKDMERLIKKLIPDS